MQRQGEHGPALSLEVVHHLAHPLTQPILLARQVQEDGEVVVPHRADAWATRLQEVAFERQHGRVEPLGAEQVGRHAIPSGLVVSSTNSPMRRYVTSGSRRRRTSTSSGVSPTERT